MIDELFHIGRLSISPFGPMLVIAFLAAYFQLRWGFRRLGVGDEEDASSLLFAGGLAGIAGGKLYYAVLTGDPGTLISRAGIVWYGSFLAGTAAVLWLLRRRGLPPWPALDAAAPAVALGYGLGRIGCFLVGDDYGRPTDLPWGVRFAHGPTPSTAHVLRSVFGVELPTSVSDGALLTVHPTQLYETALALAIWGVGVWWIRRRRPPGEACLAVVALLAVERFSIELLRVKDDRFLAGFTLAQAISVAVLLVVVVLFFRRRGRRAAADGGEGR